MLSRTKYIIIYFPNKQVDITELIFNWKQEFCNSEEWNVKIDLCLKQNDFLNLNDENLRKFETCNNFVRVFHVQPERSLYRSLF